MVLWASNSRGCALHAVASGRAGVAGRLLEVFLESAGLAGLHVGRGGWALEPGQALLHRPRARPRRAEEAFEAGLRGRDSGRAAEVPRRAGKAVALRLSSFGWLVRAGSAWRGLCRSGGAVVALVAEAHRQRRRIRRRAARYDLLGASVLESWLLGW
jgi:hypothetical protein